MANIKKSLRDRALSPLSGFRHVSTEVPEWDGVTVLLREPSAGAWLRWQEIIKPSDLEPVDGDADLEMAERVKRSLRANVTLFIDVLCDTDETPVFTVEDAEAIEAIFGPVHNRLLKQALDLINSPDDAKKK
ncbi:TPA: phage tail protein [Klebsiella aerogenes]|nr:phage tail protein [Klebsiella aerogenes]